ncbi:MAG: RNA polymerase sigma factor [Candidatus Limnocylindria bacterium]
MLTDRWEAELERCYANVLRGLIAAAGSRELAEDALQDALVAALKPGLLEKVERVDAWLYVVGLRALRKGQWRRRLERSLGRVRGSAPAPDVERLAAIEMLGRLGQRQREMVIARYWLDMSFREIAEQFGVTVGTATSTVTQALRRLRLEMDKEKGRAWTTGR